MNVYFEDIKLYHYGVLRYFLAKKYQVFVFDFDQSMRKKKWLRRWVHAQKITVVSPYVQGNDSLALDYVERVYQRMMRRSPLLEAARRLYDDPHVELAFKKTIAKQLSHFYTIQIVFGNPGEGRATSQKSVLIPFRYAAISKIVKQCGGFQYALEHVHIPFWAKCFSFVQRIVSKTQSICLLFLNNIFSLGCVMVKTCLSSKNGQKHPYDYAIPITNPNFQFKFDQQRTFDFLLDGTDIRKDNSVFLWLNRCDKEKISSLQKEGYNILNCSKKSVLLTGEFQINAPDRDLARRIFQFGLGSLAAVIEHGYVIQASVVLLHTYMFWRIVLSNVGMRHFITFNDEMIRHIGRNILLHQAGAETWYYVHSNSFEFLYAPTPSQMPKVRYWLWSFLYYDHYISWSDRVTDFQKLHQQAVKNYHNVGCLWSSFVVQNGKAGNIHDYLHQNGITDKKIARGSKVISFFDTSFFDGMASLYPLADGVKFYGDIVRLLEEMPELFALVKEKKSANAYLNRSSYQYSQEHHRYVQMMDQVKNLPHCYFTGFQADPADIIRLSDLTVTYAFSSTSVEALAVPRKAIFYDPCGRFRDCYYAHIPGLVAHGYNELKQTVRKLLFETTDQEYQNYLNAKILHEVDDYLDAKALTRFRKLLVHGNAQQGIDQVDTERTEYSGLKT